MPRGKNFTAEQIIGRLREAEVELARGKTVPEVVRKPGVTEQTYYRWKQEYGGLRTAQARARGVVGAGLLLRVATAFRAVTGIHPVTA
jgi:DNA invertase Pin-like site-specific DNA recombinase